MTIQITIIGLGQIGTSIGLALAKYTERIKRVGYDRALEIQNKAKGLGAFDVVKFNLPSAVEGADVVLLCIPLDQVEETLKKIAPDLREDSVVMDFSPLKSAAHKWFKLHIPAGRHYIGLVPATTPLLLKETSRGVDSARADLFDSSTIGIACPDGTPPEALKLANDLVTLVGAKTMFLDMLEADGMMMTAHLMPQVISAGLLNATVGQPGWAEARRFAGVSFAQSTAAMEVEAPGALAQALLLNPQGASNVLDNMIGALTHLRAAVQNGDQADLEQRLRLAFDDREKWLRERWRAEWDRQDEKNEKPKPENALKRIFLGGFQKGNKK
jgi:prephenate dehydrogenase